MIIERIFLSVSNKIWLTALLALTIVFGGLYILQYVPPLRRDLVATALLIDMVITFPIIYYFLIIYPFKQRKWNILLVITCCCAVAYFTLPNHQKWEVLQLRKGVFVLEIFGFVYLILKIKNIQAKFNQLQTGLPDFPSSLKQSISSIINSQLMVNLITSEVTIIRFGLFCWKKTALIPNHFQAKTFSVYKESGYTSLFGVLLLVCGIEISCSHLLLIHYHQSTLAYLISAISFYGTLFIISDLSAMAKLPVLVTDDQLLLRSGLRWRTHSARSNILSAERIDENFKAPDDCFKGGILKTSANVLITFKTPVSIEKLYSNPVSFHQIIMNIDRPDTFIDMIN